MIRFNREPASVRSGGPPLHALDRFTGFQRERILQEELEDVSGDDDTRLVCAQCASVITRAGARCERHGAHFHAFSNPAGVRYLIACFSESATVQHDAPTQEHTWFPGFAWQVAHCPGCHAHLGWRFSGAAGEVFFGLISDRLQEEPRSGG